jgi:outer membrane protein OmpA-like peptidoglycan-associated protein
MTKKFKTSLIASTIAVMLLGGCAEQGLVADNSYNRTKTGAVTGAIGGAVIGAATGGHHKGQRALVGALIGGAVGAGIGYSLDQQANEVASALGTGVSNDPLAELDPKREIIVTKTDTYVKIMFRDNMMFAVNSATPRASAQKKINKVGMVLQQYPQTIVQVAGFTDDTGSYDYNQELSEKRADNVAYDFEDAGASNVSSIGCSYNAPIAPNTTASNKALNRRVEVYLYPNADVQIDPCQE